MFWFSSFFSSLPPSKSMKKKSLGKSFFSLVDIFRLSSFLPILFSRYASKRSLIWQLKSDENLNHLNNLLSFFNDDIEFICTIKQHRHWVCVYQSLYRSFLFTLFSHTPESDRKTSGWSTQMLKYKQLRLSWSSRVENIQWAISEFRWDNEFPVVIVRRINNILKLP